MDIPPQFCSHCSRYTTPRLVCECDVARYDQRIAWLQDQLQQVNFSRDEANRSLCRLQRERTNTTSTELSEIKGKLTLAEGYLAKARTERTDLQGRLDVAVKQLSTVKSQHQAESENRTKAFAKEISEIRAELQCVVESLAAADEDRKELREKLDVAVKQLNTEKSQHLEESENRSKTFTSELSDVNTKLESVKTSLEKADADRKELQEKLDVAVKQLSTEKLQHQAESEKRAKAFTKDLSDVNANLESAMESFEKAEADRKELQAKFDALERDAEAQNLKHHNELESKTETFKKEIEHIRAKLKIAEETCAKSYELHKKQEDELRRANDGRLVGELETAKRIIGDLSQANEHYSRSNESTEQNAKTEVAGLSLQLSLAKKAQAKAEGELVAAEKEIATLKQTLVLADDNNCELKLERDKACATVARLNEAVEQLKAYSSKSEEQLAKAHADIEHLKQKRALAESRVTRLKQALGEAEAKTSMKTRDLCDAEKRASNAEAVVKQLRGDLSKTGSELECCERVNEMLQSELDSTKAEVSDLKQKLECAAQKANGTLQANLDAAKTEISNLQQELAASDRRVAEGATLANEAQLKLVALHQELVTAQQANASLDARLQIAIQELNKEKLECIEKIKEILHNEKVNETLHADLDAAKTKISDLQQKLSASAGLVDEAAALANVAEQQITSLRQELATAEQINVALSQHLQTAKTAVQKLNEEKDLTANSKAKLEEAVATLNNTIEVYKKRLEQSTNEIKALKEHPVPSATPRCQCEALNADEELIRSEFKNLRAELAEQREIMRKRQAQQQIDELEVVESMAVDNS